jgi:hypothetical protein
MKLVLVGAVTAVLAACATLPGAGRPVEPVVSWPGDPATSLAVSWISRTDPAELHLEHPDGSTERVTATKAGGFATVSLDDLEPDAAYRYRIAGQEAWRTVTTVPEQPEELSFAVLGDLQPITEEMTRTTTLVMEKVASLDPLFALQLGDIAEIGNSRRSWRQSLAVLSNLGAQTPIVPTAGNHDYSYIVPSARLFKSIFPVPYADSSPEAHTWHSITVGPVHIAVLDTEAKGPDFERQLDWLREDLRQARGGTGEGAGDGADWLLIAMHRPMLATATTPEDQRWARALFPIIAEYGVDAVFWGHDHLFEHYEYVYGGNGLVLHPDDPVATKPVHLFTAGTAGSRIDALYPRFFLHRPYRETWQFHSVETGEPVTKEFEQRGWSPARAHTIDPGIRYQDPDAYPRAASYYSFPFESAADEAAGRYATDHAVRYSDDAEFFGYTYGETSIHYLWIDVTADHLTVSAHYADGPAGAHGTVITTPTGTRMEWRIEKPR